MMRVCDDCFLAPSWPANASGDPSSGECTFCGKVRRSWGPSAWSDHVVGLLDLYQESNNGVAVGERIQMDWQLFRTDDHDLVSAFLWEAVAASSLNAPSLQKVEPKSSDEEGLVGRWKELSQELKHRDRYFARGAAQFQESISALLTGHTAQLKQGQPLFRARVHNQSSRFTPRDVEAPPLALCSPGRANPAGIRYLYLAHTDSTAIHEVRPQRGASVAVAEFTVGRDLEVFSLVTTGPPDFFDDGGSKALDVRSLMVALSEELQTPVLQTAGNADYVPTQYLCSLVRAAGLDGVEYPSSLDSGGTNVVLFDPEVATIDGDIKYVHVNNVGVQWVSWQPQW